MLGKHLLGYAPSHIVPALAAFGAVFCYTRLLPPEDYGHYSLALSIMTLLNATFFTWLQTSLPRLMPEAVRQGRARQLRATILAAFIGMSAVLLLLAVPVLGFAPLGALEATLWLALPLALARALLNLNQAFHRSALDFRRYNMIECGQAALGFLIGLALVYFLRLGAIGATGGLILGMAIMALPDARQWLLVSRRDFDRADLRALVRYGLPLTLSYGLSFFIAASDRFLIQYFQGAGDLGIYAAGYTLMDRIGTMLFMIVALPSFPLTIYKLEHEGVESARRQTYKNGVAALALAVPACAGLVMLNRDIAVVFIGENFRAGAMQVMPWIACSALLNGLATHYFDHAFHFGKRPALLFLSQGPTALANLAMNIILIPRFGYMGAAWSTLISYIMLVILSAMVGRRAFAMDFPFKPALQIAAAAGLMALALALIDLPAGVAGLAVKVALGMAVYGGGILALDVMQARDKARKILRHLLCRKEATP